MFKKLTVLLLVFTMLIPFANQASAAQQYRYKVYQLSNQLKTFANTTDAIKEAKRWEFSFVVDSQTNKTVWQFYNTTYNVSKNGKTLNAFVNYFYALDFAKKQPGSIITDNKTKKVVFRNTVSAPTVGTKPVAPVVYYHVSQNGKYLNTFGTLENAIAFAKPKANSIVTNSTTKQVEWKNTPVTAKPETTVTYYHVSQDGKYLNTFGTLTNAIAYAKLKANSTITNSKTKQIIWRNTPDTNKPVTYTPNDFTYHIYENGKLIYITDLQYKAVAEIKNHKNGILVNSTNGQLMSGKITNPVRVQIKSSATVKKAPSDISNYANSVVAGETVIAYNKSGDWTYVESTKLHGFIKTSYLNYDKPKLPTQKVIVLDAGHGGSDPGAIAPNKTREADINLKFALASKTELEKLGYSVIMVRTNGNSCVTNYASKYTDLQCRADLAKTKNASIFISIHSNSSTSSSARGTETYYNQSIYEDGFSNVFPNESKKLADLIHAKIQPTVKTKNLGVKNSNFYVLRKNTVPAILIETGFVSNTADLALITNANIHKEFAKQLAAGVDSYFKTITN